MRTMREVNRLLVTAIRSVMTEEQLDAKLECGLTPRQMLAESALVHTQITPDADAVAARPAAQLGPIKAYWHPHGYVCPTKPNDEWQPLTLL